jgi:hypothetical protein
MRQRGLRDADLRLFLDSASQIAGDAYLLTEQDAAREIARRKQEIQRLERLKGVKVILEGAAMPQDHVAAVDFGNSLNSTLENDIAPPDASDKILSYTSETLNRYVRETRTTKIGTRPSLLAASPATGLSFCRWLKAPCDVRHRRGHRRVLVVGKVGWPWQHKVSMRLVLQ